MGYGLDGNGLILQLRQRFLDTLNRLVDSRKIRPIEPYVYSIDHKINVARYSAGLIRSMQAQDYGYHYQSRTSSSGQCTIAEYAQRCIYYAHDWDQFSLGLLFSIESFAAAAFSLFDTCGYLLIGMYDLNLPRKVSFPDPKNPGKTITKTLRPSFVNAIDDLKSIGANKMHEFLYQYRSGHEQSVFWIGPLKTLRNHTTHSQVTDVVELVTPTPPHPQSIRLRRKPLGPLDSAEEIDLQEFVEVCFQGLEDFVEQLYSRLSLLVEKEENIPITGRFDDLI